MKKIVDKQRGGVEEIRQNYEKCKKEFDDAQDQVLLAKEEENLSQQYAWSQVRAHSVG